MEALDVVLHLLDKNVSGKIVVRVRTGPKGYGLLLRLRLLLYAMLMGFFSTRELIKYFEKRSYILNG